MRARIAAKTRRGVGYVPSRRSAPCVHAQTIEIVVFVKFLTQIKPLNFRFFTKDAKSDIPLFLLKSGCASDPWIFLWRRFYYFLTIACAKVAAVIHATQSELRQNWGKHGQKGRNSQNPRLNYDTVVAGEKTTLSGERYCKQAGNSQSLRPTHAAPISPRDSQAFRTQEGKGTRQKTGCAPARHTRSCPYETTQAIADA